MKLLIDINPNGIDNALTVIQTLGSTITMLDNGKNRLGDELQALRTVYEVLVSVNKAIETDKRIKKKGSIQIAAENVQNWKDDQLRDGLVCEFDSVGSLKVGDKNRGHEVLNIYCHPESDGYWILTKKDDGTFWETTIDPNKYGVK